MNESSPRAKLHLLGPLTLNSARPAPERAPYYAELTAYLATRRHGASADQVATAFNVAPTSARKYVMTVRAMLGTNPQTDTHGDYMGVVRTDYSHKPAFATYAAMVAGAV